MKKISCLVLLLYLYAPVYTQQRIEIGGQPETIYPVSLSEDTLHSLLPLQDLFNTNA